MACHTRHPWTAGSAGQQRQGKGGAASGGRLHALPRMAHHQQVISSLVFVVVVPCVWASQVTYTLVCARKLYTVQHKCTCTCTCTHGYTSCTRTHPAERRALPPPSSTRHHRPDAESGLLEEVPAGGAQWPLPSLRLRATAVGGLRITTQLNPHDTIDDAAFIDAVKVC